MTVPLEEAPRVHEEIWTRRLVWEHPQTQARARRAHATVEAQKSKIRERVCRQQSAGEVDGVQASDWLARERLTRSIDDLPGDGHEAPVGYRARQDRPQPGGAFFPNRGERGGSDEIPVAFEEGEVGGRDEISVIERLDRGPAARLPEQPGEDCARLGVDDQRPPRSSSRRRWTVPVGTSRARRR